MLDFWDLSYRDGSYLEHWDPPEVPPELLELVPDPEPNWGADRGAGLTALDVGCGAGAEAVYLATRGFRVIGVDSSSAALERARERAEAAGVDVEWCRGNAFDLPLADASTDLVLDRGCLHTIDREDRPGYAAEIARVLAPGGRYLLRGARDDDEEQGLIGIGGAEVDRLFPAPRFSRGPVRRIELDARAGALAGHLVLISKVLVSKIPVTGR